MVVAKLIENINVTRPKCSSCFPLSLGEYSRNWEMYRMEVVRLYLIGRESGYFCPVCYKQVCKQALWQSDIQSLVQ
jgi:hypothetical protein